ncbi:hypothetical protein BT69DRAFT_540627 [Atractiella rhizophila]|nr:hypothetical protein BT69DRAFT_540627 [Atractiella rhizophila]
MGKSAKFKKRPTKAEKMGIKAPSISRPFVPKSERPETAVASASSAPGPIASTSVSVGDTLEDDFAMDDMAPMAEETGVEEEEVGEPVDEAKKERGKRKVKKGGSGKLKGKKLRSEGAEGGKERDYVDLWEGKKKTRKLGKFA